MMTKYDLECLNRAKELMDKDLSKHFTIPEIAKHVNFSTTKLKTAFKKQFGMGLYKYHQEQRLEKGKSLLETSEKTLKEISRILGYKYRENFNTSFKKKFGKPPGSWRNTIV